MFFRKRNEKLRFREKVAEAQWEYARCASVEMLWLGVVFAALER